MDDPVAAARWCAFLRWLCYPLPPGSPERAAFARSDMRTAAMYHRAALGDGSPLAERLLHRTMRRS